MVGNIDKKVRITVHLDVHECEDERGVWWSALKVSSSFKVNQSLGTRQERERGGETFLSTLKNWTRNSLDTSG